jgi:DNA-binding GntR family transcriptional regulator
VPIVRLMTTALTGCGQDTCEHDEHDEHERIVDCIARGDANQAMALMDQLLRGLEPHLALERLAAQKAPAYLLGLS